MYAKNMQITLIGVDFLYRYTELYKDFKAWKLMLQTGGLYMYTKTIKQMKRIN